MKQNHVRLARRFHASRSEAEGEACIWKGISASSAVSVDVE